MSDIRTQEFIEVDIEDIKNELRSIVMRGGGSLECLSLIHI